MDDIDYDAQCPGKGVFHITYASDVIATLDEIDFYANGIYGIIITFTSPFNILANLFSGAILLTKELRNPFNVILSIMCLNSAIALLIKASTVYRQMTIVECNAETMTYSLSLHFLITFNCWVPFRAAYTWMTAFLTALRYRALRSKGKWEASYSLIGVGSVAILIIAAAAGIPLYMVNIIGSFSIPEACGRPELPGEEGVQVPHNAFSNTLYDNDCLLFNINQLISGIFHNTLPSLLLFVSTIMLAYELGQVRKGHNAVAARSSKKTDESVKAARMLSVVAVITLLSELPQGLLCLSNILFPLGFQLHYVDKLTMVWMTIQLISTSCNLLILLAMSRNFRKVVFGMICFCRKSKSASPTVSVISVSTVVSVKQGRF